MPGGPCTRTPLADRILSTIRRCSSFDGFGKKTSPSNARFCSFGPSPDSPSTLVPISARSANSPGMSSPFSIRSLIRFRVSVRPLAERFRRINAGAYSTTGFSEARMSPFFRVSTYSPWGLIECTKAWSTPSVQSLSHGSSPESANEAFAVSSARIGCSSTSNMSSSGRSFAPSG